MSSTIERLRDAAAAAKMIEPGAVVLFPGVLEELESGSLDFESAIARMRELKPHLFAEDDAAQLNDSGFGALTKRLREPAHVGQRTAIPNVDAAFLNEAELVAMRKHLSGTSDSGDEATLEAAAARLGVKP